MPNEKPTDVKQPEEGKIENAVEKAAEVIKEAPMGSADSGEKDAKTDGPEPEPVKAEKAEEPEKLPAAEEPPALEATEEVPALPETTTDEKVEEPAEEKPKKAAKKAPKEAAKKAPKEAAKKAPKDAAKKAPKEVAKKAPKEAAKKAPKDTAKAEGELEVKAEGELKDAVKKDAKKAPKAKAPKEKAEGEVKKKTPAPVEGETEAKAPVEEEVPVEPERTFADELREEYGDIDTATLDVLPDLERKRDRLNAMAEDHKNKRDRLNGVTKSLAMERDSYNAAVRELVQNANDNRNNRNRLNTEVKESKVLRDELNKKASELNEIVTSLKRERQGETGGPNLARMRNERKALEFKAMTQVLSADKEKELMVTIQRLNQQIDEQEKKMEENREIRTALKDSREAKEAAEQQHRHVSDLARQAQISHDTMIELYEKADDLRKKADDCQRRFIENKVMADTEHKAHIDLIRKVHDYDKFISGLRRRDRRVRKDRQEKAQKKVAEDMMDRFKKGEKLSTEDLLSLQTERY